MKLFALGPRPTTSLHCSASVLNAVSPQPFNSSVLGLAAAAILLFCLSAESWAAGVVGYRYLSFSNTVPVTVPSRGAAAPYPSSIMVSGVTGRVAKVTISLAGIEHSYPSDLDVLLVGPHGQAVVLLSDVGGEWAATNLTLTFDADASGFLSQGAPLFSGTYQPSDYRGDEIFWDLFDPPAPPGPHTNALSVFADADPNGRWDLFVMDSVAFDAGLIRGGWSLTLAAEQPLATNVGVNATFVRGAWAEARSSTMIAVEVAFTGDEDHDGYTSYDVGPSANGPWSRGNVGVNDVSGPPEWRASVIRVAPGSTNFIRVTFVDPDGVDGFTGSVSNSISMLAAPGLIGTPVQPTNQVTVEPAQVDVRDTEIFVSVPIRDDANWNSSGAIYIATNAAGPWIRKCASLPTHPKRGRLRSLAPGTDYWIRVTIEDTGDRVFGYADQTNGPIRYTGLPNLALNRPVTADRGWGCCPAPQQLVDGRIQDDNWYYGFAWTGGRDYWAGDPPGEKQATIDLGAPQTVNRAVVWFHGSDNVPLTWKIQHSLDGISWREAFATSEPSCRTLGGLLTVSYGYPSCAHEARFTNVLARYVRYVFDDLTLFYGIHGWAHEIEVFGEAATPTPPIITRQPENAQTVAGSNAVFSVGVESPVPVTYQWLFEEIALTWATSAVLFLPEVTPADTGRYSVVVSNRFGVVTSRTATLAVTTNQATWERVIIPILPANCILGKVAARTTNDVYVLATRTMAGTADVPESFVFRWDGTTWTQLGLVLTNQNVLDWYGDVLAVGESEVFVSAFFCPDGQAAGCGPNHRPRMYHSTDFGTSWSETSLPSVTQTWSIGNIRGTPGNVHAVYRENDNLGYIIRFDGTNWAPVHTNAQSAPYALTMLSPNEGYYTTCWGWGRWDGQRWTWSGWQFDFCDVHSVWGGRDGGNNLHLYTVGTQNQGYGVRVWKFNEAAGNFGCKSCTVFADGSGWWMGYAHTVWGSGPNDVYVAGNLSGSSTTNWPWEARLYHYDGGNWSRVPEVGGTALITFGGVAGTAPDDVWISFRDGFLLHRQSIRPAVRPEIARHPQTQFATNGQPPVSFEVVATNTPGFTYQWRFYETNLAGATDASLTVPAANSATAGPYRVVVTGAGGSVTSQVAWLIVLAPPGISEHPVSQQTNTGAMIIFSVTATNEPLRYQWLLNELIIPEATNRFLVLNNVQPTNGGSYGVAVINPVGAVISRPAILVVTNGPLLAYGNDLFAQAFPLTNGSGFLASGSAVGSNNWATSEPGERFHANRRIGCVHSVWFTWVAPADGIAQFDTAGSAFDTVLAIYTNTSLVDLVEVASDDDRGPRFTSALRFNAKSNTVYSVALDGFAGLSGDYTLTWQFTATANELPIILQQPQSRSVLSNSVDNLSVIATSGLPVNYLWRFNGEDLPDETNDNLTLPNVQAAKVGYYTVLVSNATGAVESRPAQIEITSEVVSSLVSEAKPEELYVSFAGLGCPSFPRGPSVRSAPPVGFLPVAMGRAGLHILNTAFADSKPTPASDCSPRSEYQNLYSRMLRLHFDTDGELNLHTVGSRFPTGLFLYRYHPTTWLPNFQTCARGNLPDGHSRLVFTVTNTPADFGVLMLDTTTNSGWINLNWGFGVPPTRNLEYQTNILDKGQRLSLSVSTNGAPSIQWFRGNVGIPGATSPEFAIPSVADEDEGYYSVRLSNFLDVVTLPACWLTVQSKPEIIEAPSNQTVMSGMTVTSSIRVMGDEPRTNTWWQGETRLQKGDQNFLVLSNVEARHSGAYRVRVSNPYGSVSTNFELTVLSLELGLLPARIETNACWGATFDLTGATANPVDYRWFISNPTVGKRELTSLADAQRIRLSLPNGTVCSPGEYAVWVEPTYSFPVQSNRPYPTAILALQPPGGIVLTNWTTDRSNGAVRFTLDSGMIGWPHRIEVTRNLADGNAWRTNTSGLPYYFTNLSFPTTNINRPNFFFRAVAERPEWNLDPKSP